MPVGSVCGMANPANPVGPTGRFVPCPQNEDMHPERLALEVKRTYDRKGKERFSTVCPICVTRIFLNGWSPERSRRTLFVVESEGLFASGVTADRRASLLRDLGLKPAPRQAVPPAPPMPWAPPYPVPPQLQPPPHPQPPHPQPPHLQPARRRPAMPGASPANTPERTES